MESLRIAILDEQLSAQLDERPSGLEGVDVVWFGTDVERFRAEVPSKKPDALVVDLSLLGGDPVPEVQTLMEGTGAQLLLVLYTFARREIIKRLTDAKARPVRSPVSLENLRGFLSGLMVRKILASTGASANETESHLKGVFRASRQAPNEVLVQPRFSMAQLGRLKEIDSAVECECPANLADVLTQLASFENYSANCQNKNDKDAEIHRMLYEETGRARAIMERALVQLMAHEKIEL